MTQEVTEFDLRAEEFKHPDVKPSDYEFRDDGKIVRKDRWITGFRSVASAAGFNSRSGFEIPDVVGKVERVFGLLEEAEDNNEFDVLDRVSTYLRNQGSNDVIDGLLRDLEILKKLSIDLYGQTEE